MSITGEFINQVVTWSLSQAQLTELPFDILLRIALLLPLKDAVLLCAVSRRIHEELTSNRTFWSSLLSQHRGNRPFKFPISDDTMALDLEALKDIILSSLKLGVIKNDYPPLLKSAIPLGHASDHRILFTVPRIGFVVTTSLSANAIYCWDFEKQILACSIAFRQDGKEEYNFHAGIQRELRDYSSLYEEKGKAFFGLYTWLSCTVHLLELDYTDLSAPKLSIPFSTSARPADNASAFIAVCVRPAFITIVTSRDQTHLRLIDVGTGRALIYTLQFPHENPAFSIAPTLLDDHLHLFLDHREGVILHISTVSISELLQTVTTTEEDDSDEDHGSSHHHRILPMRSIHMPAQTARDGISIERNPGRYCIRLSAAPHSPECVVLEMLTTRSTPRLLISHWKSDLTHPESLSDSDIVEGSRGRVTIELPLDLDRFAWYEFRWYNSQWGRTMLVEARRQSRTRSVMVVRLLEDSRTYCTTPLVLPEGAPSEAEFTDMVYDDSTGVLVILAEREDEGQDMYSFGYIE